MANLPKLEGEIVLSAATLLGTFAGFAITIPAGRYFLNSVGDGGATRTLLLEIKNQLDTAGGGPWTLTCDDDNDTSLGKVTISRGSGFTATWSSSNVRDALGFTTNLTPSASSFTGANQAKYLHLPNCGRSGVMGPQASDGAIESDYTLSIGSDGTTYALGYTKRYLDTLDFRTLKGSKVWNASATTTNGALEQFFGDVIALGLRTRFHADRATDGTLRTWVCETAEFKPMPVREDWTDSTESLWQVRWVVRKSV